MQVVRYTAWDGTQALRPGAAETFARLAEHLASADGLRQALESLLRRGLTLETVRIAGLEELLEQVREAVRRRHREVNLRHALDELRACLDDLLARERAALAALGDAARLRDALERLPGRLSAAIRALEGHAFADDGARRAWEALAGVARDVHDLEEFQQRHGDLFQGPEALGFAEAVALMRGMERWARLGAQLAAGDLDAVDLDGLGTLLGSDARRGFLALRGLQAALTSAGYLIQRENRVQLSPKGVRRIGQLALRDIYQGLLRGRPGAHATDHRGAAQPRPEETRPWRFGEPLELQLVETLKRALARRPGTPLAIEPGDFRVLAADRTASSSTVLLLDMSWSMSWEGRFAAGKKVALALESLIRSRYPRDYFAIVGFYTRAVELKVRDLPEASWNIGDPFTNLQDGLRLAADLLSRHPSANQHVIVITDGQPTAYFARGRLHCEWPLSFGGVSLRAAQETLREVERVTRRGITINTFMLDDSPSLRAFVDRMTRINKGRALYTRPDRLGEYLLVDYLARKRRRV